jgi:carbon monoxide dehydrogenase subunit G
MASVHKDVLVEVDAARAWSMLRDLGGAAALFAGVLKDSRLEGDVRTVTFANGATVRERIVDIDEDRRRVAYAVVGGAFTHHNASMQIVTEGAHACRFVWTTDLLPDSLVERVAPLMEAGCEALKRNLEQQIAPSRR